VALEGIDIASLSSAIHIDQNPVPGNSLSGLMAYYEKFISLI
jgi:hypothetical protein